MEHRAVSAYARNSKLAAYQSVSVHGGVAGADPHRLVLMLMDGALERMAMARGCIERGEIVRKAQLLHSCVSIIARAARQPQPRARRRAGAESERPVRLHDAPAAACQRREQCRTDQGSDSLLGEIRSAWVAIGPEVRQMARAQRLSA